MRKILAAMLLGWCSLGHVASAVEEAIMLEPFVVEASALPSIDDYFGALDDLMRDWYEPIVDDNLIGDFNNWGYPDPPPLPDATPCDPVAGSNFTAPHDPSQPTTKVELRYNRISWLGYTHAYLLITAPDGRKSVVRGGPASKYGAGSGSTVVPGATSDWDGTVFGEVIAEVEPGHLSSDLNDGDLVDSRTILQTNASYEDVMAALTNFVNAVNATDINYNPLASNSNSVAHEAPRALGLPRQSATSWAPGANTHILCP